ncbi:exosortase-associated protein EpsI, V-type [Qipengyuania sediminis]|uniref:exosortase-associated protein EpsI, V-type n=1 Tax=Qipengyuania sediminis TaxID=1532023 RepID=UPI0010597455|nr:exosortase-associated protein EpsI, V-type [Qipengyuania sediminis]
MVEPVGTPGVAALDRRKVLLGLGLAAMSGIAQARMPKPVVPRISKDRFTALVPKHVGDFTFDSESGLVLPPSDALSDRLYDNLVTRTYTNRAGQTVMLLIAYNNKQDGVLQIHRPETCYPAGGYELSEVRPIEVPITTAKALPAQVFAANSDERNEVVLYWTRVGERYPRRWHEQRWAVAEANLQGIVPDGVLARVSAIGNDKGAITPMLSGFVRDLHHASGDHARRLLFGQI